jgi:hypothetical protein
MKPPIAKTIGIMLWKCKKQPRECKRLLFFGWCISFGSTPISPFDQIRDVMQLIVVIIVVRIIPVIIGPIELDRRLGDYLQVGAAIGAGDEKSLS